MSRDCIYIRDLQAECIIGTMPEERDHSQRVVINLALSCDLSAAGESDALEDTVNYRDLKERILGLVKHSEFYLIERLAASVANICLEDKRVGAVTVSVDKPGALTGARSVAVEITRSRQE